MAHAAPNPTGAALLNPTVEVVVVVHSPELDRSLNAVFAQPLPIVLGIP